MKRRNKFLSLLLVCAMVVTLMPATAFASTGTEAVASVASASSRVNIFTGPKAGPAWTQVLTYDTIKDNGTFDPAIIQEDGYFEASLTGSTEGLQMIFQSWSGSTGWAVVEPSEIVSATDGSYLVRFTYSDITAVYGTRFDLLDRLYFNTTWGAITLNSLDYVCGTEVEPSESTEPVESVEPSESTEPVESVEPSESAEPVESVEPSESAEPVESVEPSESTEPVESVEPSESAEPVESVEPSESTEPVESVVPADAINLFTGNQTITTWTTDIKITSSKNGGTLVNSLINEDGYFAVHFQGTKNASSLIFSSWSGGESWAIVSATAVKMNGYMDYTAIYDYDTVAAVYGTKFDLLDAVYVLATASEYTLYSVDYVPSGVDAAIEATKPTPVPTVQPSYVAGDLQERSCQADTEHVKVLGRTYVDANGSRWLNNLVSGVEFTFTGTKASIDIQTADISNVSNQGRIAIYVNNELVVDDMIDEMNKTYDVFESNEAEAVVVKVMRLSESAYTPFAIDSIHVTSTAAIAPTAASAHKIEFIGDSITCGYGVDSPGTSGSYSTAVSDGSKTYAYKTAQQLGADYSMFAASGFGIISGYTSGPINSASTIPQYYDNVGFSWYSMPDGTNSSSLAWDFADYQPDAVVINLGTNDNSYCGTDTAKKAEYVAGYVDFLKMVRAYNPNATIFCTLGIMGQELYPQIEEAVAQYTAETGDTNIHSMKLDVQSMSDGLCLDWHPSETTHQKAADALTEYIKYVMNW